jgi:hypothetical protein
LKFKEKEERRSREEVASGESRAIVNSKMMEKLQAQKMKVERVEQKYPE